MIDAVIPYTLPEEDNHSFFFISQHISPALEAKMHQHEAWELYYVTHGHGIRMTGDTVMPFTEGDVVLIPPSMPHYWQYDHKSADNSGEIRYLMVAFKQKFISQCATVFPEIRHRLQGLTFPSGALKYGISSSSQLKRHLLQMNEADELGKLCEMLRVIPLIFTTQDHITIGRQAKIGRDIRRMQEITTYVMAHYIHTITLDEIAAHAGMNRSAFCTFFKRYKGMTFSQFLTQYRIETARELLKKSAKQVSEICFAVGFNDLPHFTRVFKKYTGVSPMKYRQNVQPTDVTRVP